MRFKKRAAVGTDAGVPADALVGRQTPGDMAKTAYPDWRKVAAASHFYPFGFLIYWWRVWRRKTASYIPWEDKEGLPGIRKWPFK